MASETRLALEGNVSVNLTPVLSEGPLLVTSRVYVRSSPNATGSDESALVNARSALVLTAVVSLALLFPLVESGSAAVTLAVFVISPSVVGATTITTSVVSPAALARRDSGSTSVAIRVPGVTVSAATVVSWSMVASAELLVTMA